MHVHSHAAATLFARYDKDDSGYLDREELHGLLIDLNNGAPVSKYALNFVIEQSNLENKKLGASANQRFLARNEYTSLQQLKPAIALWKYLQFEQQWIDTRWDDFDVNHDNIISVDELRLLLTKLNDGIEVSEKEARWVMLEVDVTGRGGLVRSELRAAVAMWYPNIYNRRNLLDLEKSTDATIGLKRWALAAQVWTHEHDVMEAVHEVVGRKRREITAAELQSIMLRLNHGRQVSDWALRFVMTTADVEKGECMNASEIHQSLAVWQTLQQRQLIMDSTFAKFDLDSTVSPSKEQMRMLLTELNEGTLVSMADTSWVMDAADVSKNGELDRDELRSAIALWYFHIVPTKITARGGWKAQVPWAYTFAAGIGCSVLVAGVSMNWSEAKTKSWLVATGMSLVLTRARPSQQKSLLEFDSYFHRNA